MKTFKAKSGPFRERPFYSEQDIESLCVEALAKVGLLPKAPGFIRIERFIEKRFGVSPSYEDLDEGTLGLTRFGRQGVTEVVISQRLEQEGTKAAERRIRSTMAHEAGHGLLHAHLFALAPQSSLFDQSESEGTDEPKVLCRGDLEGNTGYNGEWWEFQANRTIGALLMPKNLVEEAIRPFMIDIGKLGFLAFDRMRTEEAARALAETFDVNPAVARVRIAQIFPINSAVQPTF